MVGHIEALPPAVQDFKAGLIIQPLPAAVAEIDGAAQPGTAHLEVIKGHVFLKIDFYKVINPTTNFISRF